MLADWLLRLRSLLRRGAVEQELDDELHFHLEQHVSALIRQGLTPEEAVRRAHREFGPLDQIREEHRDARGIGFVDDLARDLRYAVRQIRRSPGFASLAVLCLGVGIGVNTAIFGVINSLLLRPMSVAEPEQLVMLARGQVAAFPYSTYKGFEHEIRTLSGLTASFPMESDLDVDGESEFVAAEVVSANYGRVLGVSPLVGRWFADDAEPAAVISYAMWERRFRSSPDVLGPQIRSESQTYTIVGVAPREFTGVFAPLRTDIWVPIRTRPGLAALLGRPTRMMMLFGRLQAESTVAQVAAELNAIDARTTIEDGRPAETRSPILAEHVRGVPNPANRRLARNLTAMLAAVVGLVLLIACVNVGNLLLARGAVRHREVAVRRALGASRVRVLRQLLTESLVFALGGGICGVILAVWTNKVLASSVPRIAGGFAVELNLSLDWRVLGFAAAVSVTATVLCGLWPAWRTSQSRSLTASNREIQAGRRPRRAIGLIAQVAMSLVLLFVAGSFVQALLRLHATDPGFEVANRLYAYVFIPSPPFTAETGREFYSQAVERLRSLRGVRTAAVTSSLPLMPSRSECTSSIDGPRITARADAVGDGFFDTMGVDILAGRDFTIADFAADLEPVIVNATLAGRIWPRGPSVGERILIGCDVPRPALVIGVARDTATRALGEAPQPHLYRAFARQYTGGLTAMVVDTTDNPVALVQPVRRALVGLGQGIRVYAVQPLGTHVDQSYALVRWQASIVTAFGVLALLLASIGLYGAMAYRVALRTPEIGVRMALGARRHDIFREVLGHGLAIVLVGVLIGEVLTAALTRFIGSVQEGIAPSGLTTHLAVGLIWIAVACLACFLPAAHAARVNPLVALRYE